MYLEACTVGFLKWSRNVNEVKAAIQAAIAVRVTWVPTSGKTEEELADQPEMI